MPDGRLSTDVVDDDIVSTSVIEVADRRVARPRSPRASSGGRLKLVLRALDGTGLVVGWAFAVRVIDGTPDAGTISRAGLVALGCLGIVAALAVMASKRLWLSRVCAVRSAELQGLGQTAVLSAIAVIVAGDLFARSGPARFAMLGAFVSFVMMTTFRAGYTGWLRRARRRGRFIRPLVLVGATRQSVELGRLVNERPGAGYRVIGVCGPRARLRWQGLDRDLPWLGDYADAPDAVRRSGATGALVVASALDTDELNRVVRGLVDSGCHVHLSSGVRGIAQERLLALPMAREPLFYVEQRSLTRSQLLVKRALDVVVGGTMFVLSLPVLLAAAAAVKLGDGGPVFFFQERVGHRDRHFTLYKLRTMVPDAEARRIHLLHANDRDGGPLFKLGSDPRVTRVGRWLRASSIDELPQLINVLRGDMSLVGPRPALPREVVSFDAELQQRALVMPGITGLWQVEGRDDPSFSSYRRLDLFYVDNWSLSLDLAILASTCGAVISRAVRLLMARAYDG